MEKLNSDEKMEVLMRLEGREINRVCQTSKNMARICGDKRYDPLWRRKIKEEFNTDYDGPLPYDEYKFLYRLKNKDIYIVIIHLLDEVEQPGIYLFYSLDEAKKYLIQKIVRHETFKEYHYQEKEIVRQIDERIADSLKRGGHFHAIFDEFTNINFHLISEKINFKSNFVWEMFTFKF